MHNLSQWTQERVVKKKNPEQVKILWSKQINLVTIKLMNNIISDEYKDFAELFMNETSEETLSAH